MKRSARCTIRGAAAVALVALVACSTGDPARPASAPPEASPLPRTLPQPASSSRRTDGLPRNIAEIFTTGILPTCSVNAGVCHNSNHYPDLRNLGALRALVGLPCGLEAETQLPDACEPAGDRIRADGVDVAIHQITETESDFSLEVDGDLPTGPLTRFEIRRGDYVLPTPPDVILEPRGPRTLAIGIAPAPEAIRAFFRPRLPLREDHVWPADVNRNGVAGATLGWREIVPGHPERSYLVARLWDKTMLSELMPRQCRTWSDSATVALACWIEGLQTDASGAVLNFDGDVDYAACRYALPALGRCGTGLDLDAIVERRCTGCHGGTEPAEGLDLRNFRTSLLDSASKQRPDFALVKPGSPDESYLFLKLTAAPPQIAGEAMPRGGTLRPLEIAAFREWIAGAAP